MNVVSVIGARPQMIKAAAVSRLLRQHHTEILVHTGQHYDANMSRVFFEELDIPEPEVNLNAGSGSHAVQTAKMLVGIEEMLVDTRPDWVLVYGDTNSTLAGALAAAKLHIRVAHVEAGLRSFNRRMPEEINRVLTDHIANLLFCPSQTAVDNLAVEGVVEGVYLVGDVMADALAFASERARQRSAIVEKLGVEEKGYYLATVHRPANTDDTGRLGSILTAFGRLSKPIIFPVHPRTRKAIDAAGLLPGSQVHRIDPVGYLDMVRLEQNALAILTDSGGIQKEAYWLKVPCVTLRDETEWIETVEAGWNIVVGADTGKIVEAAETIAPPETHPPLYGDGRTAGRCVELLSQMPA